MLTEISSRLRRWVIGIYAKILPWLGKIYLLLQKKSILVWVAYSLGIFFSLFILTFGILYIAVWLGVGGQLPSYDSLNHIRHDVASEVFSSDGLLLGTYYRENRIPAEYSELPDHLIYALIATEDARYYQHSGVDKWSMVRVMTKSIILRDQSSGGGSTITQQLAKNLFPRKGNGLFYLPFHKIREMMVAGRLEKIYSKQEILALYLNTIPFGENLYGIQSASRRFFDTSVDSLTIDQSAVLVGMLKANTYYNPRLYPDRALTRRNVVLSQMEKYGYLSQPALDSLHDLPLDLTYTYINQHEGLATHFREFLRVKLEKWLEEHPKEDGTTYNLYTDGLKIITTLDSRLQHYAERSVETHLEELQELFDRHWKGRKAWSVHKEVTMRGVKRSKRYNQLKAKHMSDDDIYKAFKEKVPMQIFSWEHGGGVDTLLTPLDSIVYYQYVLHSGLLAMHPRTGNIKAYVGGFNHRFFPYDHARAQRQVGSTFKPIVYAQALEAGIDPCNFIENEKKTYKEYKNWTPGNADGKYGGYYSMKGGLTHSVNTISVQLVMKCGVPSVVQLAKNMGIKGNLPQNDPSICLGTADLSLMDMVPAYCTFVNNGLRVEPNYVLRIEDNKGNVIFDGTTGNQAKRVLSQKTARLTLDMLESVVDSGTARSLPYRYGRTEEIAGKTGTTQEQADGWFMGVTPELVVGVWVGADDRRMHFRNLQLGQGARTALPIFALFMDQVYKDANFSNLQHARFSPMPEPWKQEIDCPLYKKHKDNRLFRIPLKELFQKRRQKILQEKQKKRKKKKIRIRF